MKKKTMIKEYPFLTNVDVEVVLDHGEVHHLPFVKSEQLQKSVVSYFSNKEETVTVSVEVMHDGKREVGFASVRGNITNERVQSRYTSFGPNQAITLKFSNVSMNQLMANYQHKDWWTRPYFGDMRELPERTQSLLWKEEDDYYYLVPLLDGGYRSTLQGNPNGFEVQLFSSQGGFNSCHSLSFAFGKGNNPFEVSEKTMEGAVAQLGSKVRLRKDKEYPKVLDELGWCSWDAFYKEVNEEGILEKMQELKEKDVPVKWVMIDDGWSQVNEKEQLVSYEPDAKKFPNGLSGVINELKTNYGVNHVGVWHTIAGYWGGIDPESKIYRDNKESIVKTNHDKYVPSPTPSGFGFWSDFHKYLKSEKVDFVKVDSQSATSNFFAYQHSIEGAARGSHENLEASVGIHFNQCVINCMGMATENIFSRPISAVSRNSDDFVPGDEISFKEHALQNAYNSFYHGHFYWGDWDMYWTDHEEDIQNAVLRSVSGGPIYFSDQVQKTDPEKLFPLVLGDGRILRADQPGQPTKDCLFRDPNHETVPLKIWNRIGKYGVIGLFHIHLDGENVEGTVSPTDIPGMTGEEFLLYNVLKGEFQLVKREEKRKVILTPDEVSLYMMVEVDDFVPLGLTNKYLAPKTIKNVVQTNSDILVEVEEGGTFSFYSKTPPSRVEVDGSIVDFSRKNGYYTVSVHGDAKKPIIRIIK
ncbi:Sip1-related alpha-galactosidase [Evansella tamaricis]